MNLQNVSDAFDISLAGIPVIPTDAPGDFSISLAGAPVVNQSPALTTLDSARALRDRDGCNRGFRHDDWTRFRGSDCSGTLGARVP